MGFPQLINPMPVPAESVLHHEGKDQITFRSLLGSKTMNHSPNSSSSPSSSPSGISPGASSSSSSSSPSPASQSHLEHHQESAGSNNTNSFHHHRAQYQYNNAQQHTKGHQNSVPESMIPKLSQQESFPSSSSSAPDSATHVQVNNSLVHHRHHNTDKDLVVDMDTNPWIRVTAATSGAMITSFVVTPLDVIKTRMQYHHSSHYNSSLQSLRHIVKSKGISSLWTGLRPSLISQVPASGLYYSGYEQIRNYLLQRDYSTQLTPLVAGATSRMIVVALTCPFEYIRTAMQAQEASHTMTEVFRYSIRKYGISRLWAGLGITILRDAPFSALYWWAYEHVKRLTMGENHNPHKTPLSVHFLSGASAGMLAAILTNPLDVVKTRIQGNINDCVRIRDACKQVWQQRALFDGVTPRVVKVAPACAIMISSYEMFKNVYTARKNKSEDGRHREFVP